MAAGPGQLLGYSSALQGSFVWRLRAHSARTGYAEESAITGECPDMPNPSEKMAWAGLEEICSSSPIPVIYIPAIKDRRQMENLISSDLK